MRISDWSSDVCSSDLDRRATPTMGEALDVHAYVTEATLAEGSPAIDETIAAFVERHDHEITVTSILRAGMRSIPLADTVLRERDTLILGGEPDVLERVISRAKTGRAACRERGG